MALRGWLICGLVTALSLVGTSASAATSVANPTQVTNAATALGVSGTLHTVRIDASDGSTQVTSALNSAASSATAAHPQFVYFPESREYTFNSSPQVGANVYVVLENGITITKKGTAAAALTFAGSPSGAYGGTWTDATPASSASNYSLFRITVPTVKFANLTLNNAEAYGVEARSGSNPTLTGVTVTKSRLNGINVDEATVTLKSNSKVTYSNVNGLSLNKGSVANVSDSDISRNGQVPEVTASGDKKGHGIGVNEGSTVTITNTSVNANGQTGISINGPSKVTVKGGTISNNGRHGVGTRADSGGPTILFDNASSASTTYINDNGYDGVLANGVKDAYLSYVQIKNSRAWGLSADNSYVRLKYSTLDHSGLANASIRNGSTVKFYKGNQVSYAKGGTWEGASIKGHGLAVSGASKFYITDTGNSFIGNQYYGILLNERSTYGKAYATATSVKFSGNGVGPGKVQDSALFRLEPGFSVSEFPTFRVDTGGKFERQ